jgi:muconolactone delta-isomerase
MTVEVPMKMQGDVKLCDAIARLRAEKEKNHAEWLDSGKKEGRSWGLLSSYSELSEEADKAERFLHEPLMIWDRCNLPDDMADALLDLREGFGGSFDCGAFNEGWYRGLEEFWNEIKDQL